ncbi:MAG TPA: N-acetylmuramoyl-L-alanine amidase [Rhizomicrobium sp.]|jgi:N-acetylmuramoyl-L-alanine amidase|nr:N-acetylmuramoyl-L-alanine amidase [Rhizomicrobium sp.]
MIGRLAAILGLMAALAGAALAAPSATQSADDLISKLLKGSPPAQSTTLPLAQPAARPPAGGTIPIVMSARIGEHADRTRFIVEISDPVAMRVFTLANPNRVVIDMPAVQWHLDDAPRPTGTGAVKGYRYGLFRPGNSRFVIDLNKPMSATPPKVLPPSGGYGYRVVIDLLPTSADAFERSAGWPADLKAREAAAETLAALPPAPSPAPAEKRVIVIDAGHGGIDSGTSGVNGLMEKDLVLDEALRLGRELVRRANFTVHLTRDSDVYIPLTERTRIARSWHADLFISLHADSNPDSGVSGSSIYTLSERGSDREAAALARKENQSDVIAGVDLAGGNSAVAPILIDLAQRDTMNRSSRFAEATVTQLSSATDILPRQPHRSAAFVVLKAPDVPSVLIELGYLSNADDAGRMNSVRWRNGVAGAIASAVDGYFGDTPTAGFP